MTNTNLTRNQYGILSNKENLESAQKKLLDGAKFELLDTLQIEQKMVNRKKLCEAIGTNRYENGGKGKNMGIPAGTINIGTKKVKIDTKKNEEILKEYKELIEKQPTGYEKILDILDIELAQKLTLDNGLAIEFKEGDTFISGKTAEEESKMAFEKLNAEKKYKKKLEWIAKKINGKDNFIIKWTEKELAIITQKLKEIEAQEPKEEAKENKENKEGTLTENKETRETINISLLVNRDNAAEAIKQTRQGKNIPSGKIEIQTGVFVELEKQAKYNEFIKKYEEARGNEGILKDLDTQFAEFIILDNPEGVDSKKRYYIQINNDEKEKDTKSEAELEKESFRCRDSLIKEGYDVEYITHTTIDTQNNEHDHATYNDEYIQKITEEIQRLTLPGKTPTALETRSLVIYESIIEGLYSIAYIKEKIAILEQPGKNRNEVEDRTLNILKKAWENVTNKEPITNQKKYHIVRLKTTEPKPIPPRPEPKPEPRPEKTEDLELNAVISDMGTDVHRERVSLETEEELKAKKALGRYNLPARAYLFLSRGAKRKRMIKAKMKAMEGKAFDKDQTLNEKTENASDRHELELLYQLDKVEKANKITLQNTSVNNICQQYLTGTISEVDFQTQFNDIIDKDVDIQNILKGQKITHIGTNILEKLKLQKAKGELAKQIAAEFNKTPIDTNTVNELITKYIKDFQTNPEFMADYKDFTNNVSGAKNKLDIYFKHMESVMKMKATNVKMNIDILIKGKSAYQIDNQDRQKGIKYKIGNALDKLPRWVQTAGFIGLSVGTGLLTGGLGFGAVAAAAITTGVSASAVGGMNALKKRTHYTKEQNTHEKNVVTDYRNEQKKIAERQNKAMNGKRYQRKTYKAKRQLALYDQTTQENIQISNTISDTITDLASKVEILTTKEDNYMKKNLIQGRVRLKYYRERGHNFLASNEKEQIEKDMKRLEKSIILGANKLGIKLTDIEKIQTQDDIGNNLTYTTIKKDLENSYNKSLIQFKRERRNLAIKYGIGTAALSAGMSIGAQYLFGTGIFGGEKHPGVDPQKLTTQTREEFALGRAELLDSGSKNNIYNTGARVFGTNNLPDGSTITLEYGAGTNIVPVVPGHLTSSIYDAKIQQVINNINNMNLEGHTKANIIKEISNQPWKTTRGNTDFVNDYLHGMRCAETIEQTAKSLADSGKNNINFDLNFDKNLISTTEKIGEAKFVVKTPGIPGSGSSTRGKFLQFPVFFNTFKDIKGEEKKQKEKKTTQQ